jgi:putative flippase GtrA
MKPKLLESTLVKYVITGGGSYAIELSTIVGLKAAHLSNTQAVAISFWVGLVVSFVLQKLITFKDKSTDKNQLGRQVGLYMVLVGFNYLFTLGVIALLSNKMSVFISRTLALICTTVLNYYVYKKHIFKAKDLDPFDPDPLA